MTTSPTFVSAVIGKMVRMLTFKERFEGLPTSRGFVAMCAALYLPFAFAEQFSRGAPLPYMCLVVVVGFGIAVGMSVLRSDSRVAAGLLLASVPINAALALSSWFPPLDWVVAAWGAITVLWLLGFGPVRGGANPTADDR